MHSVLFSLSLKYRLRNYSGLFKIFGFYNVYIKDSNLSKLGVKELLFVCLFFPSQRWNKKWIPLLKVALTPTVPAAVFPEGRMWCRCSWVLSLAASHLRLFVSHAVGSGVLGPGQLSLGPVPTPSCGSCFLCAVVCSAPASGSTKVTVGFTGWCRTRGRASYTWVEPLLLQGLLPVIRFHWGHRSFLESALQVSVGTLVPYGRKRR